MERATGSRPIANRRLSGGCISDVSLIELANGTRLVAKVTPYSYSTTPDTDPDHVGGLGLEATMLRYLRCHSSLPVPDVILSEDDLLLMTYIETEGSITRQAQDDAGHMIAQLHDITNPAYGFACDTLIGPLRQPNPPSQTWLAFFRDHRLLYMANLAREVGCLPGAMFDRLETLAAKLDRWIDEPAGPCLLHGDLWSGNVLCRRGRIAGFIDPAIYYGAAEMDLAFATLFDTFNQSFFAAYQARRPLQPGFFEARRELYNLYPLLVHVRLFGSSYLPGVARTLEKFGC